MNNYHINSGAGTAQFQLVAFDKALSAAGISNYNLVRVSSILPAHAKKCNVVSLEEGSPLHTAYATISSDVPGKKLATAVAVGIPANMNNIGVIMEAVGESKEETEQRAIDMVKAAMVWRNYEIERIESTSVEGIVEDGFLSLISAIAMW